MSQTTGKTSTYIKNANVKESTQIQTGFKNTRFLHQAVAGDTLIQLTSLTVPTGVVNYSAPSVSDLSQTNLMQWSSNLQLTSSDKGVLMENISYVVTGATTIKLLFDALDGEVFEGKINHQARTGTTLVDATPLVQSGTLVAGLTDFNVGTPFQVGLYSSTSHGSVLVYVDGQLMYRNTGNNLMGVGVSGDYYEVHSGAGLGQIIRFNSPDLINDRSISVISVGSLVERPNGSLMAVMESVQGQVDAMVPTLAALADVAETTFQATPNNVDLKSFGDRVFTLEKILDLEIPIQTNWVNVGPITFSTTSGSLSKGTVVTDELWVRRNGPDLEGRIAYRQSTAGTHTAGDILILVPEIIDVTKIKAYAVQEGISSFDNDNSVGSGDAGASTSDGAMSVGVYDSTHLRLWVLDANNSGAVSSGWYGLNNTPIHYAGTFKVPIAGWTATQTVRQALGL